MLEPRTLFSGGPPAALPDLADFEDPSNPAIRLTTAFGEIDIELFAHEVPELVTRVINGIESGLTADQTFFHRLSPGIALQGGLFAFQPTVFSVGAIPSWVPVDDPVGMGSGRANTERTLAIGTVADSGPLGVSPFIVNLGDNSSRYDPAEVVVYGRIIDDRSWDVVQTIASLDVADLAASTAFAGFFAGSFHAVPVTGEYTPPDEENEEPGTTVTPELLAQSFDLSVIRAPGADDLYRYTVYEPEGYVNSRIAEFVPIENPHDEPVYYELTARYEAQGVRALSRDDLVFRGVIAPHSRGGVTISVAGGQTPSTVSFSDAPFALELRSTRPLVATLSHYDFGSTIAAPFAAGTATSWYFPEVRKLDAIDDFLVWYNPGGENAEVSVTLIDEDGIALDPILFQTGRFCRGGINLQTNADVPEGVYSVHVTSTHAIVATRSHYASSGPPRNRPEGYSEVGATGEPSGVGVVPIAADPGADPATGESPTLTLAFFNPGLMDAVVHIDLYRPDESSPALSIPSAVVVPAGHRTVFEHTFAAGDASPYSLVYTSSEPVHASYELTRTEGVYGGSVQTLSALEHHFAEGFTDPGRAAPNVLEEVLSIFNPNAPAFGTPSADANVTITFRFSDGFELAVDRVVAAGQLGRIHISSLEEILEQGNEHGRFFYSIEVTSNVPVVAQMLHTDISLGSGFLRGGGFVLAASTFGETWRLDDPGPF